jgi:hypothetical protein
MQPLTLFYESAARLPQLSPRATLSSLLAGRSLEEDNLEDS